jgi:transposase InsO family protein
MKHQGKRCNGARWVIEWQPTTVLTKDGLMGAWIVIDVDTRTIVGVHFARERTASEATDALRQVIARHGCPLEIGADPNSEWGSKSVEMLASKHRIKVSFIPSWSPYLKGQIETAHRRMGNAFTMANHGARLVPDARRPRR